MYCRALALAALMATTVGASAADMPIKAVKAPEAPFFIVNDNSMSYSYVFKGAVPGTGYTPKNVYTFTHFDVWAYGTNFFTIDYLKATKGGPSQSPFLNTAFYGGPSSPCDTPLYTGNSLCPGFAEIYGLYRSTIGWNQLFNTKAFSAGPLTNIEFAWGSDVNVDNTTLGSNKRTIQGGLQFDFMAPYKGFFNVAIYAYHEWQHDGFAQQGPFQGVNGLGFGYNPNLNVEFNTTWKVEYIYSQPLGFFPGLPLTFKAIGVIVGPKGAGEPGAAQRITEYHLWETISLDVSQMVFNKPGLFSIWATYSWWKNKFGINPAPVAQGGSGLCCTIESTWIAGMTWAF
jgi:hypothetical protein